MGRFNHEVKQGEPLPPVCLAGSPPVGNDGLLFTSQDQKHKMYSESTTGTREGKSTPVFLAVSSILQVSC